MTEKITWKEFVALVEAAGIKPDDVIAWIDYDPHEKDPIEIRRNADGSIKILRASAEV